MAAASSHTNAGGLELRNVQPQMVGHASSSADGGLRMRSPSMSRAREAEVDDEEDYDYVEQELPTPEERKWGLWVLLAAVLDIFISAIMLTVAFSTAYRANGVSLYCLGIQAISHFISSVLLACRFKGELSFPESIQNGQEGLLRRERRVHLVREQILSELMGIVMLISAAALLFKAFRKISFWDKWYLDHRDMDTQAEFTMEFLSWYGFAMYVLQAAFRLAAARKLRRSILWHGFVASVVSLIFLLILGIAASYEKEWSWKAEPIAAIALSFVTLFEGVRIIILHLDDMDTRLRFDPRA